MTSRSREDIQIEINSLQYQLSSLYDELSALPSEPTPDIALPMTLPEYWRYGRQMILEDVGFEGQLKLRNTSILVVGAGGLGSSAILYLVGAGIGNITIMDHDTVDMSNLHRQVIHDMSRIGVNKAQSAAQTAHLLNNDITINAIQLPFTISTMKQMSPSFETYDLILDCTDNAPTRYLLNDACVYYKKPLVSGAAIRTEGWNVIWNMPSSEDFISEEEKAVTNRGPCYRCMFPEEESAKSDRCEDEGVLGVIPGVIGVLMACDTIKLVLKMHDYRSTLNIFTPTIPGFAPFRNIKLRKKQENCVGCGPSARKAWEVRYASPSGDNSNFSICSVNKYEDGDTFKRIYVEELKSKLDKNNQQTLFVDVRTKTEAGICQLPEFINYPLSKLRRNPEALLAQYPGLKEIVVLCRRGNDSQDAAHILATHLGQQESTAGVSDVIGGLRRWSDAIDRTFPQY